MPDHCEHCVILIAGPTASGKSAAALDLAARLGGEIVNADAMQVYRDLRVVTARPSAEDEARAPHHLYGAIDGTDRCSAGRWARMAAPVLDAIAARGKPAIVAGGTGLYFRALEQGLSPAPDIPTTSREEARRKREALGPEAFRALVIEADPAMARLPAGDSQRLLRAYEVFVATGKTLSHFQSLPPQPVAARIAARILIAPPRERLYARCNDRAEAMMSSGALAEVSALLARDLDPFLPVMKALGVPEIAAHIRGEASRDEALSTLQQSTRRFAKRQMTWFRNQHTDWPIVETPADAVTAIKAQLAP